MAQGLYAPDVKRPHAALSGMSRLAEKLIKRLGMVDAQRVCRENSWYGVLRIIQGRKDDSGQV